jgi:purine-nucleoside phosphorylase
MSDLHQRVEESWHALQGLAPFEPEVALILGTGLGRVVEQINVVVRVPYAKIPHFVVSTVESHKGNLIFGTASDRNIVAMEGRFHYYEGYSMTEVTFPVRVLRRLGATILIIVSAAGGLNLLFRPGDVMAVTDHINLIGANPLRGISDERLGDRFPDMTRPYDEELLGITRQSALDLEIPLQYGVYVGVSGPSLETRAETRMLRLLGADAVGMSTIPEVIVATQVGLRTLVLAAITNVNIPHEMEPISVDQVIANAALAAPKLKALLGGILHRLKANQ